MNLKQLTFVVLILAALSAFVYRFNRPQPPAASDPRAGRPIAEAAVIAQARQLRLTDKGKSLLFVRQPDGTWIEPQYFDFPADFAKLGDLVAKLSNTKIERLVTTNPARIARLEFADTKVELLDATGKPVWTLTIGKMGTSGGRFLRFNDEPRAYFSPLNLWLDVEPKGWVRTTLLDLKVEDLARLEIGFDGGEKVTVSRAKQGDVWAADRTPEGKRLTQEAIPFITALVGKLNFTDTLDTTDAKVAAAAGHKRVFKLTTFDGKTATVTLGHQPEEKKPEPEKKDAAVETEKPPANPFIAWVAVSDEKDPVNVLMKRRAFQVGDHVASALPKKPDDLFEDKVTPERKPAEAAKQ